MDSENHQRKRAFGRGLSLFCSLVALALTATALSAANSAIPAPPGLVGWWPGDGNAKDMAGTNNGLLQGGATATNPGFIGSAFTMDGTNAYVQVPNAPALNPTNLTLECWVNFALLDTPGNSTVGAQYIVFKQNTRNSVFEGYNLSKHRYATDIFVFEVSSAGGTAIQLNSLTAVTSNVWYHVAGVRGSNFLQLYVNGVLEAETNVNFPQDYGPYDLFFGTSDESYWDHKFSGNLDEVSLYNRALDSNEIASLYAAGSAGKCKTPTIVVPPQNQTQYVGGNAGFTSTVAGFLPMQYSWSKNGSPVGNATNSSLSFTNLQLTNTGAYTLFITNAAGSSNSAPVQLSVKLADFSLIHSNSPPVSMTMSIGGLVGRTYGIQSATNLTGSVLWRGLTNLTLTNASQFWTDPRSLTFPQSYYRIVPGPISIP